MENSRRPSEENIYLTPPWMEDEQQSSGVSARNDNMFLHCVFFLNVDSEELKEKSTLPCGVRANIFFATISRSDSQPLRRATARNVIFVVFGRWLFDTEFSCS